MNLRSLTIPTFMVYAPIMQTRELTDKQAQAFRLAGDGLTMQEIGDSMGVSRSMAKDHIRAVRKKLGIQHKRELVVAARTYFA